MKVGLGTVQFGVDYGVSNPSGKTDREEVKRILQYAWELGITVVDTAAAYGQSESVIGSETPPEACFSIVTKLPPFTNAVISRHDVASAQGILDQSLEKLHRDSVHGLLLHQASDLLKEGGSDLYEQLCAFKLSGQVKKIGVSAYDRETLDRVLQAFEIDLIQVPVSVLDQRLLEGGYLASVHQSGVEVHARSAFLQGLLMMDPASLHPYFSSVREHLIGYRVFLDKKGMSLLAGSLAFVSALDEVDSVICGVNNLDQLKEIVMASSLEVDVSDFFQFSIQDDRVLNPSRWEL
ncbi:aryl-alcohol dehydrogenase [Mariprofundus sp. NF]|uniref:aldo/keto reductase n=1 Tax=Mariprofundus sp. NF TaxID=2608716 RepID=UPI00159F7C52|nr:aldo/keto reductase [Mariprofundus sp. NF]NWF37920.1 aryl-alcohol dehydrogenase [Mariprofundus sp. NF]